MKKRLRQIADIQAGHQFRGRVEADPSGEIPVIQMKDIDDDRRLNAEGLTRITLDRSPKACLAAPGDVVFLTRGNRLTASLVPERATGALVSGFFFILRPRTGFVHPGYLAWCINQPSFQAQVRSSVRGTAVAIIAKADLQELWLELPPLAIQEKIAVVDDLIFQEKKLSLSLTQKRSQLLHALSLKAAGSQ